MKKLLLLLFSMLVSLSSYGETIVCSGVAEMFQGKLETSSYTRLKYMIEPSISEPALITESGYLFEDELQSSWDISYEDDKGLVLQRYYGDGTKVFVLLTVMIDKTSKEFSWNITEPNGRMGYEGKCEFVH